MTTVRRGAVVALLAVCVACGSEGPAAPTATKQPTVPPPAPSNFPPLTGPSRTFVFDHQLAMSVSDYTKKSQFVLYENGAFALQFPSLGQGGYRGGYRVANGLIAFDWENSNPAVEWSATGTFRGDSMTVEYNRTMLLTDFEDAAYALAP